MLDSLADWQPWPSSFKYRPAEKLEYQAARKAWISSSPKTMNVEQPEKFEYRPARKVGISSSPKSLNIEKTIPIPIP